MAQNTSKLHRFFDNKFFKFISNHKKISITVGIVLVLVIAITVPTVINSKAYVGDYAYALNKYKSESLPNTNSTIKGEFVDGTYQEEIDGKNAAISFNDWEVSYDVSVNEAGYYSFYLNNHQLSNGFKDTEFIIYLDGVEIFSRSKIRAFWRNSSEVFKKDSFGNEICPDQDVISTWIYEGIYDYKYYSPLPLNYKLTVGDHIVTLRQISGEEIALGELILVGVNETISYKEYQQKYINVAPGERIDDIEAEHFTYKNDTYPVPTNSPDANANPYQTMEAMLNIISNFSTADQMLFYEFDIPRDGKYLVNLNVNISNSNHVSFATILIDGNVPFGELLHYPFAPSKGFEERVLGLENEPFEFFFSKGKHLLSIKIDQSLYENIINTISFNINRLNSVYLSLKRIAGTVSDNNKEWDPDTDFPGITEEIQDIYAELSKLIDQMYQINGSRTNFQSVIYLGSALSSIKGILDKPRLIPNQYAKFSEGTGSIIENLANTVDDLSTTPLDIDRIIIGTQTDHNILNKKSGWDSFVENLKKFFISFTYNYSGKVNDDKTLEIWVARSRQYVDLMQELFDNSDFKEKTGYNVKFVILSDESKLILSNAAKISPDGVMGISNWLPYEMGIRSLTVDLTKFSDYGDVIKRFSTGALISLIADGKGLALPETQDFYVMYYRKDICDEYNFELPDTWDDLIYLLPKMQRNGFNFYIPLSTSTASKSIMTTAPFIYQYGGNLFSDDGTRTTIDEEDSLNGIKMMTELFTLYGLESQVANFFNSFRNGSLPIGVSTFDTYVKLNLSAPELTGKWDISLSPGHDSERNGKVERWQTGSAQSMCLINKNEEKNNAGWELLKWWSDSKTQTEFAKRLSLQYGKAYIWNSANLEAFSKSIIFSDDEKQTILNQWEWMREIPRVPGWYMLERELSNAWNNIVLKGKNTRAAIEDSVEIINKELIRKLTEFGYIDKQGAIVKPYQVTTLEMIEKMKKGLK